ncbi:MAG TPA: Crp/Fnr family transcriptional regulator [Candidatus Krumholzibacteria bacterium]|nr:Crp/Fnr family transcriptional regulator [Candidatus Krumholzibacteria bacterium]
MLATRTFHGSRIGARRDPTRVVECASLRNMEIFRSLPSADIERVCSAATFHHIALRKPIAVSPEGKTLHLLAQGLAKVTRLDANGTEMIVHLLKAGELFGPQISPGSTDTMVVALRPCVAVSIRLADMEQILGSPALAEEIDRVRSLRLTQMEERLADICMGRVPARTARTVLRLCDEFPAKLPCGTKVDVRFTQKDIANMIGATREVTSSTLNNFKREGWLGMHDRYMCVHNADGLRAMLA